MATSHESELIQKLKDLFKKIYQGISGDPFNELLQKADEIFNEAEDSSDLEEFVFSILADGTPAEQKFALTLAQSNEKIGKSAKWKRAAESIFKEGDTEALEAAFHYVCYYYERVDNDRSDLVTHFKQSLMTASNPRVRELIYNSLLYKYYDARLEGFVAKQLSREKSPELRSILLNILYKNYTHTSMSAVMRIFSYGQVDLNERAEEMFDNLYRKYPESQFPILARSLSEREQRLFCLYLEQRGLHYVYQRLYAYLTGQAPTPSNSEESEEINKFGRVFNSPRERVHLMHCYGRDHIIDPIVKRFINKDKTSSIIIGEQGVGKTAIIHEVIRRLIHYSDTEEDYSKRWIILETNTTHLMTDTRYLGEWETKLTKLFNTCKEMKSNVLLYVTNINGFLGAGRHSTSDENFCDFFRPLLMRGEVTIICESTSADLQTGIANDSGFLSLFKQIRVPEMSEEEAHEVVREIIDKNTIMATLNLVTTEATPTTDSYFIRTPIVERRHFSYEIDADDIQRLEIFGRAINMSMQLPGSLCNLLEKVAKYDLDRISDMSEEEQSEYLRDEKGSLIIPLTEQSITNTISEYTGFPISIIDPSAPFDVEHARHWFQERLIGQPEAVNEIISRLAMIKANMTSPKRPFAVYFLVGPTGVGKTYFAKLVAEYLFGHQDRMNRIDLSEFQGHFSLERLIGNPVSGGGRRYSGSGGVLTEKVQARPFSVFLLDEFEKASSDVHNLFLQVFDEARITDQSGKVLNFSQSIILMTSNVGCAKANVSSVGFKYNEESRASFGDKVKDNMKKHFAPELLNRIDKIIFFNPLDENGINKLIDFELKKLYERLGVRSNRITINLDDDARRWIQKNGFSDVYGARHLLRTMEQSILSAISKLIVKGNMPENRDVHIGCMLSEDGSEEIYAEWEACPHISNSRDTVKKNDSGGTPSPLA